MYAELDQRTGICYSIFACMDNPGSSGRAACWGVLQMVLIFASTFALVLFDLGEFQYESPILFGIEMTAVTVFTFDYVMRLLTCPDIRRFALHPLNIIDLLSILPFYILLAIYRDVGAAASNPSVLVRLLRLSRFIRLTKFSSIISPQRPSQALNRHPIAAANYEHQKRVMNSDEADMDLDSPQTPGIPPPASPRQPGPSTLTQQPRLSRREQHRACLVITGVEGYGFRQRQTGPPIDRYGIEFNFQESREKRSLVTLVEVWEAQTFALNEPISLPLRGKQHDQLCLTLWASAGETVEPLYTLRSVMDLTALGVYHRLQEPSEITVRFPTRECLIVSLRVRIPEAVPTLWDSLTTCCR